MKLVHEFKDALSGEQCYIVELGGEEICLNQEMYDAHVEADAIKNPILEDEYTDDELRKLSDGRILRFGVECMNGMVGEQFLFIKFTIDSKEVSFNDFESLLEPEDLAEINELQTELDEENKAAAINQVI